MHKNQIDFLLFANESNKQDREIYNIKMLFILLNGSIYEYLKKVGRKLQMEQAKYEEVRNDLDEKPEMEMASK